ncbi:MiaB-like tRNA modifying enzyme YliG [Catenulispora acidiphila DSM 44928]|uniref:Ribosomal protein uS12 methylthiotransferase RimO n=1 Tax=Catenulispora acidiphila (strain DSM 44928 / JCM 14897 / NBRC 102108 / NRRL B-24433 / ID139908) TaxID=479433 RepID=C7QF95_CATAD|nr:30S ribosomal protein S12 methylthiotransferase RimO [Catenulispora acidiphila]ACU76672.1 MiaB-like tRNA modifying enzyme YliG [Catenulispora acidiphila DSM 44928]
MSGTLSPATPPASPRRTVALVTLGCARNDVDSEELAGRLAADGWDLVEDPNGADIAVVNTCGFVEAAKKDSIDTLIAAADAKDEGAGPKAVVAVGCLAERYGQQLAEALPEADAVLGFDDYQDISARLNAILHGERPASHVPRDRRTLLPLTPVDRQAAKGGVAVPGHGDAMDVLETTGSEASDPQAAGVQTAERPDDPTLSPVAPPTRRVLRRRLDNGPSAPLKLASGCDRRCSFCAIPAFRGSYLSRRPHDILDEARWLAGQGVRELVLVSENSTSYGKDLGDLKLLETLLPELTAIDGVDWLRVSYLQPAEMRPTLIDVMASTEGVVPYFDLSFQHSAPGLLRRMRRFGGTDSFLELLEAIRTRVPHAGVRSNFIVGFPGETAADFEELETFLSQARLDAIGVFGYSDEDGTEAAGYEDKLDEDEIGERVAHLTGLAEELTAQRAEDRVGERIDVLVESVAHDGVAEGRAAFQGPEVDGSVLLVPALEPGTPAVELVPGAIVPAKVVGSEGVDLHAVAITPLSLVG